MHSRDVPDGEHVECSPSALIRGNGIGLDPLAAGVLEKVGTRVESLVHLIDTEALKRGHGTGRRRGVTLREGCCAHCQEKS